MRRHSETPAVLETVDTYLAWHDREGGVRPYTPHIRFSVQLKSHLDVAVQGVRFRVVFKDGFGHVRYENDFQLDVLIEPGGVSPSDRYWYWDDFSRVYRGLWQGVKEGVIYPEITLLEVALENGAKIVFW